MGMELNFLQSILLGLLSGLTEILPVSAQAHRLIALKLFGVEREPDLLRLVIHLSTLAALYYACNGHITRILRARNMARKTQRRRRRPLDVRSLMDFSLLKTTWIPIVFTFIFYQDIAAVANHFMVVAGLLFLNGLILYIPQYLPGSNRDARSMSRVDGLLMGLGGAASTLPGISCVGAVTSVGAVRGGDRSYCLNIALLMNISMTVGYIVFDVIAIAGNGLGAISFGVLIGYLLAAGLTLTGVLVGVKVMKALSSNIDFSIFSFYCWGAASFAFIFALTAA
jgi:undecaprenyl-diphosphatase